jgi:hypothetical protein
MTLKEGGKQGYFTPVKVTEIEVHLCEICGSHSGESGELDCQNTHYVLDDSDIQGLL